MKQKAVDAVTTKPFLHVIGDVAGRTDQRTLPPSCGEALVDLSDRQPFLARPADDVAGNAETAERELPFGYVGKRTIEIVFRQIEPAELVRDFAIVARGRGILAMSAPADGSAATACLVSGGLVAATYRNILAEAGI
jgi:hypothetical protein